MDTASVLCFKCAAWPLTLQNKAWRQHSGAEVDDKLCAVRYVLMSAHCGVYNHKSAENARQKYFCYSCMLPWILSGTVKPGETVHSFDQSSDQNKSRCASSSPRDQSHRPKQIKMCIIIPRDQSHSLCSQCPEADVISMRRTARHSMLWAGFSAAQSSQGTLCECWERHTPQMTKRIPPQLPSRPCGPTRPGIACPSPAPLQVHHLYGS